MTDTDRAWAAGVFEGEGHLRIAGFGGKGNLGVLEVSITNCDKTLLDPFLAWGGGIYGPYQPRTLNSRPYWKWSVRARVAGEFLREIEPFVRSAKYRPKVALAIAFQDQKQPGRGPGGMVDGYRERQQTYVDQMANLNKGA